MGLFKQMKDMKTMVGAAPGLIDQANQLSANHAAMQAQGVPATPYMAAQEVAVPAEQMEPIAGVDLPTFAQVSAGLAAYNYDASKAVEIAATRGIDEASWTTAVDGWNARIAANPAVAKQFNNHYTGRG